MDQIKQAHIHTNTFAEKIRPHTFLMESDIRLFLDEKKTNNFRSACLANLSSILTFVGILIISFSILNGQSLSDYFAHNATPKDSPVAKKTNAPDLAIAGTSKANTQISTPEPKVEKVLPSLPLNTIFSPDLGISVPILWDTKPDSKSITSGLEQGVIHIAGTSKPGQQGIVFISGHSSNYPWAKGSYNSVFAPLFKAVPGQVFTMNYRNVEYKYKITSTYQVKSDDLSVFNGNGKNGIRLATCAPLGTNLRRLIVEGEQISPDPAANSSFTQDNFSGTIPEAR